MINTCSALSKIAVYLRIQFVNIQYVIDKNLCPVVFFEHFQKAVKLKKAKLELYKIMFKLLTRKESVPSRNAGDLSMT
jgi:hypothetical protein